MKNQRALKNRTPLRTSSGARQKECASGQRGIFRMRALLGKGIDYGFPSIFSYNEGKNVV